MQSTIPAGTLSVTRLDDRALIRLRGEDSRTLLQGIVTNDVERVAADRAIYAGLLTPQGKLLFDFFVFELADDLYLDCQADARTDLARRLTMYKLRAKVTIETPEEDWTVHAVFGSAATEAFGLDRSPGAAAVLASGIAYVDPRSAGMGLRIAAPADGVETIMGRSGAAPAGRAAYDLLRISLGVPDSGRDLVREQPFPLEYRFEELNGVDFKKGCYVGQEVTARMKHRNLVRRRLYPVTIDGPLPDAGTPVMKGDVQIGEMRGSADAIGLAMLRIEDADAALGDGTPFTAGTALVSPQALK